MLKNDNKGMVLGETGLPLLLPENPAIILTHEEGSLDCLCPLTGHARSFPHDHVIDGSRV